MLEVHKRERFPLLKASVRFRFGQGTFVEMRSKDRVAPKAAAPVLLGAGGLGTSSDSEAEMVIKDNRRSSRKMRTRGSAPLSA